MFAFLFHRFNRFIRLNHLWSFLVSNQQKNLLRVMLPLSLATLINVEYQASQVP